MSTYKELRSDFDRSAEELLAAVAKNRRESVLLLEKLLKMDPLVKGLMQKSERLKTLSELSIIDHERLEKVAKLDHVVGSAQLYVEEGTYVLQELTLDLRKVVELGLKNPTEGTK